MTMKKTHDVIVIGAGAGGLTAAGGCAMLGLKAALIERGEMGGDCLNSGCVPSKAIIAAAHRAHDFRDAGKFGIQSAEPKVDFPAVHKHIHDAIATIAPEDSQERFEEMGVEVVRGEAKMLSDRDIEVNGRTLTAPRIVLAVGSKPFVPPINGLDSVDYLTNESLWELKELPDHLIVLGAGPIGLEMAHAFRRLGSEVTVLSRDAPFAKDDPEAAAVAVQNIEADGVKILAGADIDSVANEDGKIAVTYSVKDGDGGTVKGSHLLVATGRTTNFDGLGLEAAGIKHGRGGIEVDARRRTNKKHIYAIGDCRPGPQFTHVSGYEGSNVVLEIGFGLPTKVDFKALPWVTYTDPEVAQVGMTEAQAREKYGDKITVWREDFSHNDRAIAEAERTGFVKVVKKGGKVLGATIIGRGAGDLLLPWAMAIQGKSSAFGMASLILPYPNRSEHNKAAAFASYDSLIFNDWTKKWARFRASLRS
ncbi:MAG: FAD-dependent oxidoreductase [Parasphingorhabdus sp.]